MPIRKTAEMKSGAFADNGLIIGETSSKTIQPEKSYPERQRSLLGIPPELKHRPVLYFSAHRGVADPQYEDHVKEFFRTMRGASSTDKDKTSTFIDLSEAKKDELDMLLLSQLSQALEEPPIEVGSNVPKMRKIINIIYLPPLDENGNAKEGSTTFGVDHGNYTYITKQLSQFFEERGIGT